MKKAGGDLGPYELVRNIESVTRNQEVMTQVIIILILALVPSLSALASVRSQLLRSIDGVSDTTVNLVCPETKEPLLDRTRFYGLVKERVLVAPTSGRKFAVKPAYLDLTISEEVDKPLWEITNRERISSRFFQNPLIPFLYERGYRQNFENAGFPGVEKEYAEAEDFFLDGVDGNGKAGVVLDLSCGSGFMSRKFIKSNKFSQIVSADLSPTMLVETRRRMQVEDLEVPLCVRVDVAKLPFADNSLDYIHAGAAMHCWPRLSNALGEIYRVLKPEGKFWATTFFQSVGINSISVMTSQEKSNSGMYMFKGEDEITGLVTDAGFTGDGGSVVVRREGRGCAIVKAVKK